MPGQEGSQWDNYQFSEYVGTSSLMGQGVPSPGSIQPPQIQPTPMPHVPYPPYPPPGYGYSAVSYPAPPAQAIPKQKKMLCFPLTRNVSPGKQVRSMAIYSLLMLALFAGSIFFLTLKSIAAGTAFVNPDGTVDGWQIFVFILFILLILPATNLLSGALFGAARAFLVASIVVSVTIGLWLVYASTQHMPISINSANSPAAAALILSPITAALVGAFYNRRRYAAWWKSFFTMVLGSAFFVTVLLTLTVILGRPTGTSQATLTDFYVGIGCVGLLAIPLLALPIAGIEGIIHAIVAARREKK